jgi:hypothetical protein
MARSGEVGQFGSRRDCFERIGLESQTMRAIDEPDADGVDEFACRNESGMARRRRRDRASRAPLLSAPRSHSPQL